MKPLRKLLSLFRHYDWALFFAPVVLVAVGLAAIYSVDLSQGTVLEYFPTQTVAFFAGVAISILASSFHMSVYQSYARVAYAFAVALLFAVLFLGVTVRGTTGWFRVAGVSFQPAEFAKVGLILFLAWWIMRHGRRFDKWQFVLTSGIATFLLGGLILLQPDLGSALILFGIWFVLLLLAGTKKRYIAGLVIAGLATFLVAWLFVFQPYQKDRLLNFLHPENDPLGSGYNVNQSTIAIGAGQFLGRGLGFGSQSQLHFLPEAQTDFIFAVVAEELGFVGVFLVVGMFFVIIWRLLMIAMEARNDFAAYTALGIAALFLVQASVNIGGATGLLPLTGVPLPFMSYGGSSLVMNLFLVGIAQSVAVSTRSVARSTAD